MAAWVADSRNPILHKRETIPTPQRWCQGTTIDRRATVKIAQVAPLLGSIPPKGYGGIERTISHVTEELVRRGHEVTLFATADSHSSARLVPCAPMPVQADNLDQWVAFHLLMLERVYQNPQEFDVIHCHLEYFAGPLARRHPTPTVIDLHNPIRADDEVIWREYADIPVIADSEAHRAPAPWMNWQGVVYPGLPADRYLLQERPAGYLAFLGRLSPEKGLPAAVRIAEQAGLPLKVAGNRPMFYDEYFTSQIEPLLAHPLVEYIGEVNDQQKQALLGGADALLFPIEWDEPFGLVMIEALACGTPVIATPRGAVAEVVRDGENGFVIDSVEAAVAAVARLPELSRQRCREIFEERFTVGRMVDQYVAIYERLAQRGQPSL